MLDGRHETGNEQTRDCIERYNDRCELHCLKVARFFKIEDLAISNFISEDNALVAVEDPTTQKLRKETQQLLKLTRSLGLYFMILTLVYMFQSIVCYSQLTKERFQAHFTNQDYAIEIYELISGVMVMNIVHALTLISLGIFVVLSTRKFKILNQAHYMQLGLLTIVITIVYFLPVLYVSYRAWSDASASDQDQGALKRFFDMVFYILLRSEQGLGGFLLAAIIHFQLYILTFVMMWAANTIKDYSDKIRKLKESQAGTYQGLELQGVDEALEKTEAADGDRDMTQVAATLAEDQEAPEQEEQQQTGELLDLP